MTFKTMADVRAANAAKGGNWFDRGVLSFFRGRVESSLIQGRYFVTSESSWSDRERGVRRYSVREVTPDADIRTVGEFYSYHTKQDAKDAIRELLRGGCR